MSKQFDVSLSVLHNGLKSPIVAQLELSLADRWRIEDLRFAVPYCVPASAQMKTMAAIASFMMLRLASTFQTCLALMRRIAYSQLFTCDLSNCNY